jgi:hypothetical protein
MRHGTAIADTLRVALKCCALERETGASSDGRLNKMLNRVKGKQELDRVNMLIRALSDEMIQERGHTAISESQNTIPRQMKEALYELRLRKLLICALVSSDRTADAITHH